MRKTESPEHLPQDALPRENPATGLEDDAHRLLDVLARMGRRNSLRDPIGGLCEQFHFTPAQAHTMLWLGSDGPLTMGVLSRRGGITEKTMTGIIDRLEAAGLVQRERDEHDRRVVRVRLTASGEASYKQIDTEIHARVQWLLGLLSPADRHALIEIFERLNERLAQSSDGPAEDMS